MRTPGPWVSRVAAVLALACLVALPYLVKAYTLRLAAEIMIYAILAMSLNLVLGQTGLPSMGHAAFYGAGAYAAGWVAKNLHAHALITLPAGVVAAGLVAVLVGFLSVRTAGIYFLMLTLAFGQMIKAAAHSWVAVTGGPDGLASIPRPLIGPGIALVSTRWFYYLALLCFLGVLLLLARLAAAPLGRTMAGIRENERRMRALGYNTFRFKLAAFTLAGACAGLAGGLHAHLDGFVSTGDMDWSASAIVLVMVVIGGAGNLYGSVFGAAIFVLVQNRLSSLTPYWHLYLGLLFITYVMVGGQGLNGVLRLAGRRWKRHGFWLGTVAERSDHDLRRVAGALEDRPESPGG